VVAALDRECLRDLLVGGPALADEDLADAPLIAEFLLVRRDRRHVRGDDAKRGEDVAETPPMQHRWSGWRGLLQAQRARHLLAGRGSGRDEDRSDAAGIA